MKVEECLLRKAGSFRSCFDWNINLRDRTFLNHLLHSIFTLTLFRFHGFSQPLFYSYARFSVRAFGRTVVITKKRDIIKSDGRRDICRWVFADCLLVSHLIIDGPCLYAIWLTSQMRVDFTSQHGKG